MTPADIAELNALIDAMVRALDRRDYGSIVDLDLAFHGRVVALSGFRLLRQVWASIDSLVRGQTRLDLDSSTTPDERDARFRKPALSHRELVDGLSSGRPSLAANAARRHIQDASGRLYAADIADGTVYRLDSDGNAASDPTCPNAPPAPGALHPPVNTSLPQVAGPPIPERSSTNSGCARSTAAASASGTGLPSWRSR